MTRSDGSAVHRHLSPGPDFSQVVDCRAGVVRGRGRLTAETAGLLCATVEALAHDGHVRILLDLTGVQGADELGTCAISSLQTRVEEIGGHLAVVPASTHRPDRTAPPGPNTEEVQIRPLSDYDAALGLTDGGVA